MADREASTTGPWAPKWAFGMREGLTPTMKAVLLAIAFYADREGSCFPSIERIASDTRLSARACQKAIPELEAGGFLTVNRNTGRGHASVYHLNLTRPTDTIKGAPRSPFEASERVKDVHPLSGEKVQDVHPLPTERVNVVRVKGAPRSPQLAIELKAAATRVRKHASGSSNPSRSSPPQAWLHLADQQPDGTPVVELSEQAGPDRGRPLVAGTYLDVAADLVCEAARFENPNWRGNWSPLLSWLRQGLDLHATILPALRGVAARSNYVPPASLAYFNNAIAEFSRRGGRRT